MTYYKNYMDRQSASAALHARLLKLPTEKPKKSRVPHWPQLAAAAACCLVLAGLGVWKLRQPGQESLYVSDVAVPDPAGVTDTVHPTAAPAASAAADKTETPKLNGFAVKGGEAGAAQFVCVPYVAYPDLTNAPAMAGDMAWPEGSYTVELTEDEVCTALWGSAERYAYAQENGLNVPWMLYWDGFTVRGSAVYDGTGALVEADLQGLDELGREFYIQLAPNEVPATDVIVSGAEKGEWAGTEYEAWSFRRERNGEADTRYVFTLMSGDVGVRSSFIIPDDAKKVNGEPAPLSDLFLRWCCSKDTELTLRHLLTNADVPAYRHVVFERGADAWEEIAFVPYLPAAEPAGFAFEDGELRYQEGNYNQLWLCWTKGYDAVSIRIEFPEGGDDYGRSPVDVSDPAQYDVRLYEIPWCDSVPEEYQDSVFYPTFRAEDMSREIVAAREQPKDTGGSRYLFRVLHADGALVSYDLSGMSVDAVWTLLGGMESE